MPWKECDRMSLRIEFVALASAYIPRPNFLARDVERQLAALAVPSATKLPS